MELPGGKELVPPSFNLSDIQLVESIPIPAFICDAPDAGILCYNRLAVGIWGFEPLDSRTPRSPLTCNLLFRPDGSPVPRDEFPVLQAISSGVPVLGREAILQVPSGERIPVLISATPLFDAAGDVRAALACFNDLREVRRAQALAQKSESDLLEAMDSFGTALWEFDFATETLQHTPGFWHRLGFPPGQVMGGPAEWHRIVHPDDHESVLRTAEDAIRTGGSYRIDYRVVPPDGIPRWIRSLGRAVVNEHGVTVKLLGMAQDVTEAKRFEAGLRASEEWFRELAETVPDVLFINHPDGTSNYFIERFRELTGTPLREVPGEGWKPFVHPDDLGWMSELRANAIRQGIEYSSQYRIRVANGDYHWVLVRVRPVKDSDGRLLRWVGTVVDIDDIKADEERRRQSQKLESVGLLAAGVAHDFNNLLTGIIGSAGLLDSRLAGGDPNREQLQNILTAGERAADLTRQLLAYAGVGKSVAQPMDLAEKVGGIAELIRGSVSKKIRVLNEFEKSAPLIQGDPVQLQQLVMNLVLNAAEAIGVEVGKVVVRVSVEEIHSGQDATFTGGTAPSDGRYVVLTVADDGCGMDLETRARMFDPFFTTKSMGRGLGLAAAHGIVTAHGGAIQVDSFPGRGTTVRVLFPELLAARDENAWFADTSSQTTGRILLVDDEEVVLKVALASLREGGFGVIVARDGREAVERFEQMADEIDAVVLDLTMPVMGGEETLERIRQIRPDIPVLACSGFGEEAMERLKHLGISGFLQKPYRPAVLVDRVRRILDEAKTSGAERPAT